MEKSTGTLEIERATARPAAGEPLGGEEESGKDLRTCPETGVSEASAAAAPESQSTESHLLDKTDGAEAITGSQAEAEEGLSPASSGPGPLLRFAETSLQHDGLAAHTGMAGITVEESPEEPEDSGGPAYPAAAMTYRQNTPFLKQQSSAYLNFLQASRLRRVP